MTSFNEKGGKKAITRRELAEELGISVSTLWRLLKRNKLDVPPGLIYPSMVEEIFKKIKKK